MRSVLGRLAAPSCSPGKRQAFRSKTNEGHGENEKQEETRTQMAMRRGGTVRRQGKSGSAECIAGLMPPKLSAEPSIG